MTTISSCPSPAHDLPWTLIWSHLRELQMVYSQQPGLDDKNVAAPSAALTCATREAILHVLWDGCV